MPALRGRVVDDTGAAVRNFKIRSRRANEETLHRWVDNPEKGTVAFTNDAGTFEIPDLEPGEWILTASGMGESRSVPRPVRVPHPGDDLTLVLPREAVVTGTVHLPDGKGLVGADIFVSPGDASPFHEEPRAQSNGDGVFRVEGVPAGRIRVRASHPDHGDSDETEINAPPGMSTSVEIRLIQGGRISGHVDPSQQPVAGRHIQLYSFHGSTGWKNTVTDASGAFEFKHVIPEDYIVELRTPGRGENGLIRKKIRVTADQTVHVMLGEPRHPVIVKGRIMSRQGPVANEELEVTPKDESEEDRRISTRTDDIGGFAVNVNGPGPYVFRLAHEYSIERTVEPGVELAFHVPVGAVSAVILSEDGRPVERAGVTLLRVDVEGELYSRYRRTRTRQDGSFEIRFLEPGLYVLRVPEGFQHDRPPPRTPHGRIVVGVKVGELPLEKRTVRLPPEGRISGQVLDNLGRPCAAWIMAVDEKGTPQAADWETRTDSAGWFEVRSLAPGTYTLHVQVGEVRKLSELVKVEAGRTSEVTVRFP